MQLRDLLVILGHRWRTLAICLLLVVAATMALTMRMPSVYEASTRVFLSSQEGGFTLGRADMNTYAELVSSPIVLDPLRESLGLTPQTPIAVSANLSNETAMMTIRVQAPQAQLAADIANAVGPQLQQVGGPFTSLGPSGTRINVITVSPAGVPGTPVSPNTLMNLLLALLAGMGLGVGMILLQHFLDTRIRSEAHLSAISHLPVLARLRQIRDPQTQSLVVESAPHTLAAEEFRRLRTNLQFIDVTTDGKHSFQVTSAMPGEGKTLTSVNLALAIAEGGTRVLLVDCDMRHPSVAKLMGLEGSVGLTTLLLRRASLEDVAQQWRDTTLDVLPAGSLPPNPGELIASDAMEMLFDQFTSSYDFVIVDAPPVNPVTDPVLINRLVGGILMVVRLNQTGKRELTQALRSLATVDIKVSGFALNGLPNEGSDYYGHYHTEPGEQANGRSRKRRASRSTSKRTSSHVDAA